MRLAVGARRAGAQRWLPAVCAAAVFACAERRPAPAAATPPASSPSPPASGAGGAGSREEVTPPSAAAHLDTALNRSLLERLDVPAAWQYASGRDVIVAVIDNGFYAGDPVMAGAYLDEQLELDNVVHRQDVACAAHGSSVAATIAARPTGPQQIAGIAPAAKILRISFGCPKWIEVDLKQAPPGEQERLHLDYVREIVQQGARALDWAADRGAKIINFSTTLFPPNYGQLPASRRLADADLKTLDAAIRRVRERGVLFVAAAGNWAGMKQKEEQAEWQSSFPERGLFFPASSEAAVAAGCVCGATGERCEYIHSGVELNNPQIALVRMAHSYGEGLDFVSYCDGVPNVLRQGTEFTYRLTREGGTSNAAPAVSGVLALAWSVALDAPADRVLQVLERSSTDLGPPGYDEKFGFGVPNAARAVQLARSLPAQETLSR